MACPAHEGSDGCRRVGVRPGLLSLHTEFVIKDHMAKDFFFSRRMWGIYLPMGYNCTLDEVVEPLHPWPHGQVAAAEIC